MAVRCTANKQSIAKTADKGMEVFMIAQLLATNLDVLKTNAQAFFNGFGALQVVEIILLFTVIFFVSKILRDNDATNLMLVYWCILVSGGCISVFAKEY